MLVVLKRDASGVFAVWGVCIALLLFVSLFPVWLFVWLGFLWFALRVFTCYLFGVACFDLWFVILVSLRLPECGCF